ncbi:MAG TPA: hypothetical protein VK550_09485 [Polyangiaceae bacterium]|nr:hypothetical protein [Polyangiaceae bacterium]
MRVSPNWIFLARIATACFWTTSAAAQATFYQVPSGDITNPRDLYFQQQSTLTDRLDFSFQGMVGVGFNFDAGLSVYNFDLMRIGGKVVVADNDSERSEPATQTLEKRLSRFYAWPHRVGRPRSAFLGFESPCSKF